METIFREYGKTIEITRYEHKPSVRIYTPRTPRTLYGARRFDSILRAKKICVRRVSAALEKFGSPLFISTTFRGDSSDAYRANKAMGTFQMRMRRAYPGHQSLFVPELSPRGRIHFHGLCFNMPMHLGDIRERGRTVATGSERSDRGLAKLWGEGWLDCLQTDGSERLAHYIAKYITKAGGGVLFNAMHLLRITQGFPKEYVARDLAAEWAIECIPETKIKVFAHSVDNPFLGSVDKEWYR